MHSRPFLMQKAPGFAAGGLVMLLSRLQSLTTLGQRRPESEYAVLCLKET